MEQIAIVPLSVIEKLQKDQEQILNLLKNSTNEKDDDLIPVKEAAKITGLSEQNIRDKFDKGILKGIKIGPRSTRIYRSSL